MYTIDQYFWARNHEHLDNKTAFWCIRVRL